ncbi:hypothetical protein Tco_1272980 [Tanacetum coccineum]
MAGEWIKELLRCFIEYYQTNFPKDFQSDLEYLEEKYRMINDEVHNQNSQNASPSETKEPYEPSPRMYSYEQPLCLGSTFVGETLRKSDQLHQTFEKSSIAMTHDEPIGDLDTMKDKAKNPSPQSTPQGFPSVDELEPQLLPNFSPLDVNLRDKRRTDPPINPYSPGSFRMKEIKKIFFIDPGDGVRINPDGVTRLYLMRRSLEVLRKFSLDDSWRTI